jgi:multisubunit Na+/H+ antiporter MnhG subunit
MGWATLLTGASVVLGAVLLVLATSLQAIALTDSNALKAAKEIFFIVLLNTSDNFAGCNINP